MEPTVFGRVFSSIFFSTFSFFLFWFLVASVVGVGVGLRRTATALTDDSFLPPDRSNFSHSSFLSSFLSFFRHRQGENTHTKTKRGLEEKKTQLKLGRLWEADHSATTDHLAERQSKGPETQYDQVKPTQQPDTEESSPQATPVRHEQPLLDSGRLGALRVALTKPPTASTQSPRRHQCGSQTECCKTRRPTRTEFERRSKFRSSRRPSKC